MKLSSKIAYNTIVQFAGKAISTVLGLVSLAMMTRYLGQAGFGSYTTITNYVSFFAIIADLGLTLVTVQMISRPGVDEKKALNNLFGLRLASIILFLGLAPVIAIFLPYTPYVKIGVMIAALSFLFPALNQILIGLFQKRLRMDKSVIAETLSRVIMIVGIYLAIIFDRGLNGFEVSQSTAQPTLVNVRHACTRRFFSDDVTRLTFCTNEQYSATTCCEFFNDFSSFVVHHHGFFEVDDMNFVAMAVDERSHFRIPEASLMAKVATGFKHFTHRY